MENYFKEVTDQLKKTLQDRIEKHKTEVLDTDQFQEFLKNLSDYSWDAMQAIRAIALYSTREERYMTRCLSSTV